MSKHGHLNRRDPDLVAAAKTFASAFKGVAAAQKLPIDFAPSSGLWSGEAGVIEITEEVAVAQSALRARAIRILGSKSGHERAIDQAIFNQANQSVRSKQSSDEMATAIIDAILVHASAQYQYVAPNRLYRFSDDVRGVRIGAVRAMLTSVFQEEREKMYPDGGVRIIQGAESGEFVSRDDGVDISMFKVCWIVDVDAVAENVEEEGKWLIDVALSLLRLSHTTWQDRIPENGYREPHPIHRTVARSEGLKLKGSEILGGGGSGPRWYDIDASVAATVATPAFIANAAAIFAPRKDSLAARVAQGLGWLSRGRQATDRAERLLYFFTAIEALLSSTEKSVPVVQTIARHAGVLLSNDNAERALYASQLKSLYSLRSALVHSGTRGVDGPAARNAQGFAEMLFYVILRSVSLKLSHKAFTDQLATASYGLPWPPSDSDGLA